MLKTVLSLKANLRFLLSVIFIGYACTIAEGKDCIVTGRVVTDRGEPIHNALVLLDLPTPPNEWEWITNSLQTDLQGHFNIKTRCGKSRKEKYLYISSPLIPNAATLVYPPFHPLRSYNNSYAGKLISLPKKGGIVNVGDIQIQVWYILAELVLQEPFGQNKFTNKDQWLKIRLRVKDKTDTVVYDAGISVNDTKKAVRADASSLTVALPEGIWNIELLPEGKDGKSIAKKTISVSKENSPIKVDLIVRAVKRK